MESNWAAEHLQVIRTLMERTAIYRRALVPIMILIGSVGTLAAVAGLMLKIQQPQTFIGYWLAVSILPIIGSFLLARREALREAEPFWSPPTRRVAQAAAPALGAGMVLSVWTLLRANPGSLAPGWRPEVAVSWLLIAWVVLYGCALHAAGFFMPRGMKLLGWFFIAGGCGLCALDVPTNPQPGFAHGVMGFFFGLVHLAYGAYLYFTEKRKNVA